MKNPTILLLSGLFFFIFFQWGNTLPYANNLSISQIQGEDHLSPYANQKVKTSGIVTGITKTGFFIQTADDKKDKSSNTSEGIFILTGKKRKKVKEGDFVSLEGTVEEYYGNRVGLSLTRIKQPTYQIESHNNLLPQPIILGQGQEIPPSEIIDNDSMQSFNRQEDGLDFWESLEGMLVRINNAQAVGSTAFGAIYVVSDLGKFSSRINTRGSLTLSANDFNPERITLDDAIMNAEPKLNSSAVFRKPVIGLLHYVANRYESLFKVYVKHWPPFLYPKGRLTKEITQLQGDAKHITIASYNLFNLVGTDEDQRFERHANIIVNHLKSPDILALQEIGDSDGTKKRATSAKVTLTKLIQAISEAGGPQYQYQSIAPRKNADGGKPNINIRVAYLYKRVSFTQFKKGDAVTPIQIQNKKGKLKLSANPGRMIHASFIESRKPLVGEFQFNEQSLFIINNHLKSKREDQPLMGKNQPPYLETEKIRIPQSQVIHEFVTQLFSIDPQANVIVLGDFNDFQFSKSVRSIESAGLTNLINKLPREEQYTYIYQGNAQALDHILVSEGLAADAEIDIVHVNAEFVYTDDKRASDHDPVLARIKIE